MSHQLLALITLICLTIASICFSCGTKPAENPSAEHGATYFRLRKEVKKINDECPIPLGAAGKISSMKLNADSNIVIMTVDMPGQQAFDLMTGDRNLGKRLVNDLAGDLDMESESDLFRLIAENGTSFTITYRYRHNSRSLTITPAELDSAINSTADTRTRAATSLQYMLDNYRTNLPLKISDKISLTDVMEHGDTLVFQYTVADRLTEMERDSDPLKDRLIHTMLTDPGLHADIETIRDTGKSLTYRYTSSFSGRHIDIIFSNDELHYLTRK